MRHPCCHKCTYKHIIITYRSLEHLETSHKRNPSLIICLLTLFKSFMEPAEFSKRCTGVQGPSLLCLHPMGCIPRSVRASGTEVSWGWSAPVFLIPSKCCRWLGALSLCTLEEQWSCLFGTEQWLKSKGPLGTSAPCTQKISGQATKRPGQDPHQGRRSLYLPALESLSWLSSKYPESLSSRDNKRFVCSGAIVREWSGRAREQLGLCLWLRSWLFLLQ